MTARWSRRPTLEEMRDLEDLARRFPNMASVHLLLAEIEALNTAAEKLAQDEKSKGDRKMAQRHILLAKDLKEASIFHKLAREFKNAPLYLRFEMVTVDVGDEDNVIMEHRPALIFETCWKEKIDTPDAPIDRDVN